MELLTPRDVSQTTEIQVSTGSGRVTIPDPSNTLGDPVVERTKRQLVEAAGPIAANRNAPGSGLTAPYGTIDDTGRVELFAEVATISRTRAAKTTELRQGSTGHKKKIAN